MVCARLFPVLAALVTVLSRAPDPFGVRYLYDQAIPLLLGALSVSCVLLLLSARATQRRGKLPLLDFTLLVPVILALLIYVRVFYAIERRTRGELAPQTKLAVSWAGDFTKCGAAPPFIVSARGVVICSREAVTASTSFVDSSHGELPSSTLITLGDSGNKPILLGVIDIRGVRNDLERRIAMQRMAAVVRHARGETLILLLCDTPRLSWTYWKGIEMFRGKPLMPPSQPITWETLSSWVLPGNYAFLFYRS